MRWWPHRGRNGDAKAAAEQQAKFRAAQRMTPMYEQLAPLIAELPAEVLAARLRDAFTLRPTT